jgi:oligoribonuclease (3'-5' exoribonuclease)
MTGLDIKKDHLIEIAVLITDGDLNIVAKVSKKERKKCCNNWKCY